MAKKHSLLDEFGNLNVYTEGREITDEVHDGNATENTALANFRNKQDLKAVFNMLLDWHDFIEVNGQLYIYDEEFGYWKLIPESNANREIRRLVSTSFFTIISKSSLGELYEWLLLEAPHKDENIFFQSTKYINFRDCAIDWDTKKKYEKDRKKLYFRYALNIEFPKENSTGVFRGFVHDIYPNDKHSKRELSKLYGLGISDIRDLKYMSFLYGPSNTGKTITQALLEYLVGADNCASISFSQMSSEFAITQLVGKRLNLSGEVSGATTNRLDIIKSITGNDKITACYKGKDHFQFKSNCLLVFACNCFPKINDFLEVQSFLERVVFFPFVNVKDRKDWDNNLLEKLKEDTAGIIDFALEGLRALKEDDYTFKESKAMLDCKRYFSGMFDSFSMFADKYIEAEKGAVLTSSEITEMYRKFCDENDYTALADNQWAQIIKRDFVCYSTTKSVEKDSLKTRVRGYKGIKFKPIICELYDEEVEYSETITDIPEEYYNHKGGMNHEE